MEMHLYNAWLPPPVVEEIQGEEEILGEIVSQLSRVWKPEDLKSRFGTLKWISLINNLVKSKVVPPKRDLDAVVKIGFDVFFRSSDNLFVQVRWATCLSKLMRKYHKHLTLELEWRKLYDIMLTVHFKRRHFFEGIGITQIHLESLVLLIGSCRQFFDPASALEIWNEFKPLLEDGTHNSSLEALGFLSLLMPTKGVVLTSDWLQESLRLWDRVRDCPFWDRQWAALISRFIKHAAYASFIDFTPFLPQLFSHFLAIFEVPVAKLEAQPPVDREVPYSLKLAFNSSVASSKSVAKAIIYLLKPDGHVTICFGQLVDLLEQYYHPSNGGSWTTSLEVLLRQLAYYFIKRLAYEQRQSTKADNFLGPVERQNFVKTVIRLIERAQYSKSGRLAVTASNVSSALAFVAPAIVLPFVVARFEAAMLTVTATHQLESALTTLALSSRGLLLSAALADSTMEVEVESENLDLSYKLSLEECKSVLADAMFTTLLGMDANDPPKTLATLQFYCSVISSIQVVGEEIDSIIGIDWSQWLDEFLSRLFVLLRHVESSSHSGDINLGEGSHKSLSTFLMQDQSLYSTLIELLLGKLTKPLFQQAIKKIAKFVHGNILPGAVTEVGLLCSALVYAHPTESVAQVLIPVMQNVLNTLVDSQPATGSNETQSSDVKAHLSPATETSVATQVTLLSLAIMNAGPALLQAQDVLKSVLNLCFSFSSTKVNEAGDRLLSSLIESLVLYYPLEQYKSSASYPGLDGLEAWVGTKDTPPADAGPSWHLPSKEEIEFAEDIVTQHLRNALSDLQSLCQSNSKDTSGQAKDKLRIVLLRISGSLRGLRACLPDFSGTTGRTCKTLHISGSSGASVGTSKLREEAAEVLIQSCEYLLKTKADDTALLILLVQSLNLVGNYGSSEYNEWANGRHTWRLDSKSLMEPRINFITGDHYFGKRRPRWMMIEVVYLHNLWRASQAGYRQFEHGEIPPPVQKVAMELLKLSLHNYNDVRVNAASALKKILKRFPPLVKACMPLLTKSLQDPDAVEHSALGACAVLTSRPLLRHVTQDWNSLAMFMVAVLRSSHLGTIKAQTAISELALAFSVRFSGVPSNIQETDTVTSYPQLLSYIKESLQEHSGAVHWRYQLMAYVGLLCLVLPLESTRINDILESRRFLAGEFLKGVASDLPPLRPLSVLGLLLLVHSAHYKSGKTASSFSVEEAVSPTLQEPGFAEKVVKNLSLDHHYLDGHGSSSSARSQSSDASITTMMPTFVHQWPTSRNWLGVNRGDAFSLKFAKLFKRIVQECGPSALAVLRGPLQQAVDASEDRGMQCVSGELLAGLLHSDVSCVADAWDDWLGPLFYKAIMQANVESLLEWAACVRFSVTGKGRSGVKTPLMRQKVLEAVIKPLSSSASTSLISKRLQYILSSVVELRSVTSSKEEMKVQLDILLELLDCMSHGSSQVRQFVGRILCVVCTNLQDANVEEIDGKAVPDWSKIILDRTLAATTKIQKSQEKLQAGEAGGESSETSANDDIQDSVEYIETVFQFLVAAFASGRTSNLLSLFLGLLQSVLSLQETSHKEMSGLAKLTTYLLKWQLFQDEYRSQAVKALVTAASDNNWRTRVAALSFLQSFVYRHTFILDKEDVTSLWNCVQNSLADAQLEVRAMASTTLAGMLRGLVSDLPEKFRASILSSAAKAKPKINRKGSDDKLLKHSIVMGLRSCILSVPYDVPRWLPDMIVALAKFTQEPSPISTTVRKTIAEFRRTHADTWAYQKNYFTEEQLEVLSDLSSSASYFA